MREIKVIVLAGSRDFGRSSIASRLPPALWPVLDKSVLERLLRNLSRQSVTQAIICSNGDTELIRQSIGNIDSIKVSFINEELPLGSAGCMRDAADGDMDTLFIVLSAAMVSPPDIKELVRAHQAGGCEMTVVFESCLVGGALTSRPCEIYICESSVLKYISPQGYCDLKEGLIPALNREGKSVYALNLDKPVGSFRNHAGYLAAVAEFIGNFDGRYEDSFYRKMNGSEKVWLANSVKIDPSASIYGPAVIMDNAAIEREALIFGPVVIGRNVTVGKSSLLEKCVFWGGSAAGKNCRIRNSLVDCDVRIPDGCETEDAVVGRTARSFTGQASRALYGGNVFAWAGGAILAGIFIWSYWFGITELWDIWRKSDEYSSGMLVPFFAIYIFYLRRAEISKYSVQPSMWGLFGLIFSQAVRYFGLYFMYSSAERLSLVLTIASVVLLIFGWNIFRKLSPVLLFLCLMLPPPRSVHIAVMLPLQTIATKSAVFCLQTMGYSVAAEGNIINLEGTTVAVSEACNGLRMVTAFFVVTGFIVLILNQPFWGKLILFASALPVALLCNTVRLTATAVAFTRISAQNWEQVFHDFGGYAMMPLAIAAVVFELWLLSRLTVTAYLSK